MSLLVSTTCIALVICSYYLCRFLVNFCLRIAASSQRESASLPSTEPSAPQWMYDVFLSFRGEETRKGIAFEIYDGLKNRGGIRTFMDEQELPAGAPISPTLLKAIEESRFAIIVLSPNYASSPWCLEELTKIVECMKDEKEDENRILPLFYRVEPSDVRHQNNSFKVALTKLEATKRHDRETIKKWRYALTTVANFSGWETKNFKTERELVEDIVESVCNKVGRQVAEITKNLQTEVDKLTVAKATMAEKVTAANAKGEKIHAEVQDWLNKVDDITKEAQEFLTDEIQPTEEPNDSSSHRSKKSFELLQVVTELYKMREFSDVSYVGRADDACLASPDEDYEKFDSRVSALEKIMKELASSSTDMILVYGIGGVGKTTLAEEVLRQAKKQRLFDDAVMVRDVKIPKLEAIQNQIADKLGLPILNIQTVHGRADKINERIKKKKSLVILDDVWGEIDLKAVGLPHIPTCRILLTSRSQQVFSINIKQTEFPLGVLDQKEAWILFEKKAGDVVADPAIQSVATQVAQKCGGLPVFIITVARALENKTLPIWKNALKSLEKFDELGDLTQKAYEGIEWSYMQLSDQELKSLFLLCGTIVQGNYISLTNLLRYSIGLGFFEDHTVEEAQNALCAKVDKLKSSCLLLEGDANTGVRMHDLVHDVAKRIARRDEHVLVDDGGPELKKWPKEDFFNECTKIALLCCNIATLPGVPWECPKLEMFHLHNKKQKMFRMHNTDEDDSSWDMPSNFLEVMKKLKVLGLNNLPLISLPPSLKCLENLQTLCLDGCKFEDIALVGELRNLQILSIVKSKVKQLPKEIEQLTRLRSLDLSDCDRLEVISPGVISNLTSLEELRMRNSFDKWQGTKGVFREISSNNASLSELKKLSKLRALEIRIPDADILPPDLFSDNLLERYQIFVGDEWRCDRMYETTLNTLKLRFTSRNQLDQVLKMLLKNCDVLWLIIKNMKTIWQSQLALGSFGRLREVHVSSCDSLKSIFSASMATSFQQLQKLKVTFCDAMETIVAKEEGRLEPTTPHPKFVFPKVKSLVFYSMSTLRSFYPGPHVSEWPLLEDLTFDSCDKVELLAAELSIIQERQYAQTNQPFFLINQEVMFNNLTTLRVDHCDSLKCLFSSSVAQNFKKLKHLEVLSCKIMEQIISTTKEDEEHNMFGELKSLTLVGLPNLARFCIGKCIEFPLLEALYITQCNKLGVFVGGPMTKSSRTEETRERESEENFLFDEKVRFPRSEIMHLKCPFRLRTIWQGQLAQGSFGRLRKVELFRCDSVRSIFPPSMMGRLNALETLKIFFCESVEVVFDERGETNVNETHGTSDPQLKAGQNPISVEIAYCPSLKYIFSSLKATRCLQQLQKLKVENCVAMETIVAKEEGRLESTTPHPNFVFPKVKSLVFDSMSTLRSFYAGLHDSEWPLLKDIKFEFCDKVELLAAELSIVQERQDAQTNQPFFFINQDSFPVLENIVVDTTKIFYGQSPAESIFSKLKSISFNRCAPFYKPAAVHFLQKLHNPESLKVDGCQSEEIFGEYSIAVGSLPSVRNLDLCDMDNLMHLGKEKYSQPIFPNLEFLSVRYCDGLKNLESSAISFQNLTALEVCYCNGLECLIPYSIAKCLVHLTKMEVSRCESIVVIVASNGDDDAGKNEIAFSRLQQLTLGDLPSLQGFFSVNCIAKLPSSLIPDVTYCPIKLKISTDGVPISVEVEDETEDENDDETEDANDDETAN